MIRLTCLCSLVQKSMHNLKNVFLPLFVKVFKVMDVNNKGYVTKQDIEVLTVEQVKQMANEVDGDPANTEEYEFALFELEEIK